MGVDEDGMAVIEAEIVANPTQPMIRGTQGSPQSADTAIWDGQAGRWARGLLRGGWEGHILHDGCLS